MRVLLDTHILLWSQENSPRLSDAARQIITDRGTEVFVSSVSIWEVAIKAATGKLRADVRALIAAVPRSGFLFLPFTERHALRVSELPELHKDPFDRALVAQSQSEPLILLTRDQQLAQYGAPVRLV